MLDVMELRGFKLMLRRPDNVLLVTPDGTGYAVQFFPDVSFVECVFEAFQSLNHMFP